MKTNNDISQQNKRQILMVGPYSQGGITTVIDLYLKYGLADYVMFLPTYKGGNFFKKLTDYLFFFIQYLNQLIFNNDLKIVHIHASAKGSFLRKLFVLKLAKLFLKKTIFHMHSSDFNLFYDSIPQILKWLITDTLNNSDIIIALSPQWQKDLEEKCSNKNIKVLYNPTAIKEFKKVAHDGINVLFMGILGQRKGAYDLVEACHYTKNEQTKIRLYGDGEVEKLKDKILNEYVGDKINVEDWIQGDDVEKAYQEADIYVLPSYNEGLPMSILEALGHGLPVISTPVGGIPEAVTEGVNGYLIEPGDVKALAEKIDFLSEDKKLREKMGKESLRIAKEKFEINLVLKNLHKIYDELLYKTFTENFRI